MNWSGALHGFRQGRAGSDEEELGGVVWCSVEWNGMEWNGVESSGLGEVDQCV